MPTLIFSVSFLTSSTLVLYYNTMAFSGHKDDFLFIFRYCEHLIVAVFGYFCMLILYNVITKISQLWKDTYSSGGAAALWSAPVLVRSRTGQNGQSMTNQKVTCEQIETVVTNGDCLMCESQVPGHVPEGARRKRCFADGDPEERESHSCNTCSWGPGSRQSLLSVFSGQNTHGYWTVEIPVVSINKLSTRFSKWSSFPIQDLWQLNKE